MKKHGILNAELAQTVAALGHGDRLVIGDAGLPVPPGVQCIDLAVTLGIPGFWDVLETVLSEMAVETAVIATEASTEVKARFPLPVQEVSHTELKEMSRTAVAVVRTGETVPYSNIVLIAGVAF